MGTRFEAVLSGEDPASLRAAGEAALACIEDGEARWSLFRSDSLVARINREAAERPVRVDEDTYALLELALAVRAESGGAFDPCLGAAMRAHGFRARAATTERTAAQPETETEPGELVLDPDARAVRLGAPGTTLDLGAIAKGFALDLAAEVLRDAGVACALVHGGTSSVVALGAPPEKPGWRVGLGPVHDWDDTRPRPSVLLADRALGVSGPHGRTVETEDGPAGHVLDPATGEPTRPGPATFVVAPSAALADAWSTAAAVLAARGEAAPPPPGVTWLWVQGEAIERVEGAEPERFELPPTPTAR